MAEVKTILGIDPMGQGALAYLNFYFGQEGGVRVVDMPVVHITKTRLELDCKALYQELLLNEPAIAFVEKMQPMGKGGNASFKAGAYRDALRMAFAALSIPLVEVLPKEWQKEFGIKSAKGDDTKHQSYLVAARMFPSVELVTMRGRIIDGRSDALLIAEYGRRKSVGSVRAA